MRIYDRTDSLFLLVESSYTFGGLFCNSLYLGQPRQKVGWPVATSPNNSPQSNVWNLKSQCQCQPLPRDYTAKKKKKQQGRIIFPQPRSSFNRIHHSPMRGKAASARLTAQDSTQRVISHAKAYPDIYHVSPLSQAS